MYVRRIQSDEQFNGLVDTLPDPVRLMVATAMSTGMRISEILGLKWGSVDLIRGLIHVEERYYRGDNSRAQDGSFHPDVTAGRVASQLPGV